MTKKEDKCKITWDDVIRTEPIKAPEGKNFLIFGRVDSKHWKGSTSWMGIQHMKEGTDWHLVDPPQVVKTIPKGEGWLCVEIPEGKDPHAVLIELESVKIALERKKNGTDGREDQSIPGSN